MSRPLWNPFLVSANGEDVQLPHPEVVVVVLDDVQVHGVEQEQVAGGAAAWEGEVNSRAGKVLIKMPFRIVFIE